MVRTSDILAAAALALACAHPEPKMTFGDLREASNATATSGVPNPAGSSHPRELAPRQGELGEGSNSNPDPTGAFTDEELLDVETDLPPTPPVENPAPARVASERAAGPPIDGVLLRFAAEARIRRASARAAARFPPAVAGAWEALAADVEGYLARPMPQTPLAEIVRARVTLDAELDLDRQRFGDPPPALAAALADELRRLGARARAARALGQALFAPSTPPALRWPVADAGLSSLFGPRLHPIDHVRRMHYGIDLAAAPGRVVAAAAKGFVVHAGVVAGYGLAVEVRHTGELTSRYAHLSRLLCSPGDAVEAGQPLGLVGATGRATGPHLHFEVWRGARAEDPLPLLRGGAGSAGG